MIKSKRMRWAYEGDEKITAGKPEGKKRPLGRPKHRWENNNINVNRGKYCWNVWTGFI
jgi:hypothetical protein